MSDIGLSLYDINTTFYEKEPDMNIIEAQKEINKYFTDKKGKNNYHLLLSWELRYITMLEKGGEENVDIVLLDCLKNIGILKGISKDENGNLEFWIQNRTTKKVSMVILFPYDKGVEKCMIP